MIRRSIGVFVALAALANLVSCTGSDAPRALPNIVLQTTDGQEIGLGARSNRGPGEASVFNLWAMWCAPCRAELPVFQSVADELLSLETNIEIIGVNVGDDREEAAKFLANLGIEFRQALDPLAKVQSALNITSLPATVFVDGEGVVISITHGAMDRAELVGSLGQNFDVWMGP